MGVDTTAGRHAPPGKDEALPSSGDEESRAPRRISLPDEFLAVASHELRTPIGCVKLALDAMSRLARKPGMEIPAAFQSLLDNALHEADHLVHLSDMLLDAVRLRTGTAEVEPERVDLVPLVRDAIARLETSVPIDVVAHEPVIGNWDPSRLDQIITNLVSNAVKYGGGKPVTVRVMRDGTHAQIVVEDYGIGIPADRIRSVFEPFERAVPSKEYRGLGLGLYIVRQTVRLLGGTVDVSSTEGAGSAFTVRLPLGGRA